MNEIYMNGHPYDVIAIRKLSGIDMRASNADLGDLIVDMATEILTLKCVDNSSLSSTEATSYDDTEIKERLSKLELSFEEMAVVPEAQEGVLEVAEQPKVAHLDKSEAINVKGIVGDYNRLIDALQKAGIME